MTAKEFKLIAKCIRETRLEDWGSAALNLLSYRLADMMAASNPRFDRDRFLVACGTIEEAQKATE